MKKKAYMSPESEVINIKIERLMNSGSDPQAHDEEGNHSQLSRRHRRNNWEDEDEEEEEDW